MKDNFVIIFEFLFVVIFKYFIIGFIIKWNVVFKFYISKNDWDMWREMLWLRVGLNFGYGVMWLGCFFLLYFIDEILWLSFSSDESCWDERRVICFFVSSDGGLFLGEILK